MRPLHVVIVDEELPYPLTSGKRIRTANLVLRLARRHRITYLCHRNADEEEARQAATFFADHGVEPIMVERPVPRKSGLGFYLRLAANLFSPLPYSVTSHTSRALKEAAREYAANHSVDLWQCEWTPYAETLRDLEGAPRVIMAHNIESQIWQRYGETEEDPLKRWYIKRQWRKFQRFERRAFAAATRVVTVSTPDADLARSQFEARHVSVVDNGVDTSYFRPDGTEREPGRILFLGSLDWRPNLDAVRLLLDHIFPAVLAAEPLARLSLVGRNPPEWLARRAAEVPNVELAGNVADVRPYLCRSGVMVVPLRVGGGSRLKILESLASGLPVVSTTVGAEGLCLEDGQHLTIADGVEEMARALLATIDSPGPARAQAGRGREVVLSRYDWDALGGKLEAIWRECAGV
ncbi:MAG: glycosyltransferase [Planctomycetes bacterium]|nr:glycosyltransferase [Planctomycetota bacterium]